MGRARTQFDEKGIQVRTEVQRALPAASTDGAIVSQILEGIPQGKRGAVEVHVDREKAIREAILGAGEHDVVVIAGKGHETEQISVDGIGGLVRRHFDDREVAGKYLRERMLRGEPATAGGCRRCAVCDDPHSSALQRQS